MNWSAPDLEKLVTTLDRHGVQYVLVGGFALVIHGGDSVTTDVDLAVSHEPDNHERLAHALNEINPRLKSGAAVRLDRLAFGGEFSGFLTDAGPVDIIRRLGPFPFGVLHRQAERIELFGVLVPVARLEDLRALKADSERQRDQDHVRTIDALLALRAEG
ncbi:MAG TPA: hypothetical protein PLH94_01040 [Fimbriimonadaceae bacterium]|nr:hypothetical protein [Fimbriimonadaceae bacterium]